MGKAGRSGDPGQKLQSYIKELMERFGIPLRECAGSGNKFASDSDLSNRYMQVEAKCNQTADGLAMPRKADWKKLCGEAKHTSRFPMLVSSGQVPGVGKDENVLIVMKLQHLLSLLGIPKDDY